MNRRDVLKLMAATPAVRMPHAHATQARNAVDMRVVRWKLRHTWTTVMSSSQYRDNLYVKGAAMVTIFLALVLGVGLLLARFRRAE